MLFLGIYPEKMKILIQKGTCTRMFIAVQFTIAKTWKQPKCSPTDQCIKKIWYTYRMEWQGTPVFLPGASHEQRSLSGYSTWEHKESDTTE